jgi:lysophospholipase L1-like esterase
MSGMNLGNLASSQFAGFTPASLAGLALWFDGSATLYTDTGGTTPAVAPSDRVYRANQPSPLSGHWQASSAAENGYADAADLWLNGGSQSLTQPSGPTATSNDCTLWVRLRSEATSGTQGVMVGTDGTGTFGPILNGSALVTLRASGLGSTGLNVLPDVDVAIVQTFTAAGVRSIVLTGGSITTATESVTIPSGTAAGFVMGTGFQRCKMRLYSAGLIAGALVSGSFAEVALLHHLDRITGPPGYPTGCPLVVVAGDSIAYGYTVTSDQSWAGRMSASLSSGTHPHRWAQTAVPGYIISQMVSDYPTRVTPLYSVSRTKNVLIAAGATNDIAFGSETAAQVLTAYYAYCDAARAAGWKVVACTVLPRSDVANSIRGTFEADRTTFNTDVVANWASHADAIANVASVSGMGAFGDSDNATNYGDKVHPSPTGHGLLEPTYTAAVESLIP